MRRSKSVLSLLVCAVVCLWGWGPMLIPAYADDSSWFALAPVPAEPQPAQEEIAAPAPAIVESASPPQAASQPPLPPDQYSREQGWEQLPPVPTEPQPAQEQTATSVPAAVERVFPIQAAPQPVRQEEANTLELPQRKSLPVQREPQPPQPSAAGNLPAQTDQQPVRVKADTLSYHEPSDTVTAAGGVVVTKGDTTVTADTISVNRTTNELTARGEVVVKDTRGNIEAETLHLNIEDETGEMTNGTVRLPRNQYILAGETLSKGYGQTYHIKDGVFTTCLCEDFDAADWSIAGDEINVTVGGKGEVYDGIFRVRGVPVLYVPYGVVSVRTERQSGLLTPNYGFSSKRGFQWQQPFYWAINRSHDLTVTADVETSARLGALGEYRYALSQQTEGEFSASYFNEQIRGPATTDTPTNRWSVTGTHRQKLTDDLRLYSDLFFVSDDLFLREINVPFFPGAGESDLRARRFTDSYVGGVRTWNRALLRTEASYYQDLRQDDDFAFQVLPRVQFEGYQRFWRDLLEAGVAVEGVHFYRDQGYTGQRFDFAPSVALPFHFGPYAFGSLKVIGRETIYHMTSDEQGQPPLPEPGRLSDQTRETAQVQAQIGTRLSRIFQLDWGRLSQLQHVVEPEVSYLYTPFVDQEDLPLYDALDRINQRNLLVYGVSNRLLGKFTVDAPGKDGQTETQTQVRELARIVVTQAYDPSRGLDTRRDEHFSDLELNARLTPLPYASFTLDSTYDVGRGDVTAARLGAFLSDPRALPPTTPLLQHLQRRTTVGVTYQTIT
ncbi:MAG: LPS assembly protein LptD, partial [Candidatus Binatia bacterium]